MARRLSLKQSSVMFAFNQDVHLVNSYESMSVVYLCAQALVSCHSVDFLDSSRLCVRVCIIEKLSLKEYLVLIWALLCVTPVIVGITRERLSSFVRIQLAYEENKYQTFNNFIRINF